jgi:hypothetical protein
MANNRPVLAAALLLALLPSGQARAQDGHNIEVISQLAAGYAWGAICNRQIDIDTAAAFLDRELGAGVAFDSRQIAEVMMMTQGTIALERELVGSGPRACAEAMKSFGPGGAAISGLLK